MPLQATSGAASYDAFGGGVAVVPTYIEDVFSTWLYTGTGATQTITNGIDTTTYGGLTWIKGRSGTTGHRLTDTARGATKSLASETTAAEATESTGLTAFGTTGFTIGADADYNTSAATYVSLTFREQPKFFDVVTYTGNGTTQNIAHSLAGTVGSLIIKRTDATSTYWLVYHKSLPTDDALSLNTTNASNALYTPTIFGNNTVSVAPTSTQFTVGNYAGVNASGGTYVAYLFAHNAGGFGLTGTDNVITCGSFTTDGSGNASVNLGYEPQFWLYKPNLAARYWTIYDVMRGWSQTYIANLNPNVTDAEGGGAATLFYPTATGFDCVGSALDANTQHIYIAIRRGPMKVPTTGTSVFSPVTWTGNSTKRTITGPSFPPDMAFIRDRSDATGYSFVVQDKLRGPGNELQTWNTGAEVTGLASNPSGCLLTFDQNGVTLGTDTPNHGYNVSSNPEIGEFFKRAPSFFDEVCYTGTGSNPNVQTHNLGVAPELMIVKRRNSTANWLVATKFTASDFLFLYLDLDIGNTTSSYPSGIVNAQPTATSFSIANTGNLLNASGGTYVAYLFASCPGVSKVGSYTGTGTTQTINCGFTGGARFVLIKRTDSTGDWYVWDTARGIVAGNDPYLLLNSTAAEVTSTDYIDTASTGFEISSTAPAAINASGGTFIFLAIA